MRKLRINDDWYVKYLMKEFELNSPEIYEIEKNNKEFWEGFGSDEIDLINIAICDISDFKTVLYKINEYFFGNSKKINVNIAQNNFTMLILNGVIDVIEIEDVEVI